MRHREEPITMIAAAATSSIGRAVALRLAKAGHRLALIDRRSKALRALAEEIASDAASVRVQTGDILQPRRIRHFVDDMLIHYGRIDNVVFAPDDAGFGPFLETNEVELEAHLDISLRGPWYWLQAAIPSMREHGGGRIIFIGTNMRQTRDVDHAAYGAAKGALQALVSRVAVEHRDDDVRPVSLVLDGPLDSPAFRTALPAKEDWSDAVTLDSVAAAVESITETPIEDMLDEVHVSASG